MDTGECSDLKRVWAWTQGRAAQVCGNVEFRNVVALGDGYVVFWTPLNGYADLWRLDSDEHFGEGPLSAFFYEGSSLSRSLTPLNQELAFEYNQATSKARLRGVLPSARGEINALFDLEAVRPWPRALGGRNFLSLKDNSLLDFELGSGNYAVVRYETGGAEAFTRFEHVGQREAFRRGHRWLPIGESRLLEWLPRAHEFHVWGYDLSRLPNDVLSSEPLASGNWPELREEQDLLPLTETRVAIWDRALGTLDVRALSATAEDPLGTQSLGVTQDGRFRSLTRPFVPPTQSRVKHLVIVFTQGASFDAYFGRYCRADPGSAPSCEAGANCCEAAPPALSGVPPSSLADLDDSFRPDDSRQCLLRKQRAWAQNEAPASCGDERDFSCLVAVQGEPPEHHRLASEGLLADRYYASVADSWETNFLFFATGAYTPTIAAAGDVSIASFFSEQQVPFATYVPDITYLLGQPAPGFADAEWAHFRDVAEFDYDAALGQLAPVSVIVAAPSQNDSRAEPDSLAEGARFISSMVEIVRRSSQGGDTLLLVAPLTGSGFYDHLSPAVVPSCDASGVARGLRVPLLAFGPFVERGRVAHNELEHASLTSFIEWNWLGKTGQLRGRDVCAGDLRALLTDAALASSN